MILLILTRDNKNILKVYRGKKHTHTQHIGNKKIMMVIISVVTLEARIKRSDPHKINFHLECRALANWAWGHDKDIFRHAKSQNFSLKWSSSGSCWYTFHWKEGLNQERRHENMKQDTLCRKAVRGFPGWELSCGPGDHESRLQEEREKEIIYQVWLFGKSYWETLYRATGESWET